MLRPFAPTIPGTDPQTASPGLGVLTLGGFAPTVTVGAATVWLGTLGASTRYVPATGGPTGYATARGASTAYVETRG